jgi:hypothetical protein
LSRAVVLLLLVACQQASVSDQELQTTSILLMQVADGQRSLPCVSKDEAFVFLRVIQTYGKAAVPEGKMIALADLETTAQAFCQSSLLRKLQADKKDFSP